MSVFAREGDLVTCENGHPICTVAIDLQSTDIVRASQFKDWQIPIDTRSGSTVPNCPTCGAKFMGHGGGRFPFGNKIFIGGKWLPEKAAPTID